MAYVHHQEIPGDSPRVCGTKSAFLIILNFYSENQ